MEDRRFYQHQGVDWRGTVRALLRNAQSTTSATQGGSTLTQQYVKNYLYLVEAKTEAEKADAIATTPIRKLREAKMALTPGAEPQQGRDPRAVPQPGRVRAVAVRRRGRVAVVLRRIRRQADDVPGRAAGRHGEQPAEVQPARREPRAGRAGPPRPGARRHGRGGPAVQGRPPRKPRSRTSGSTRSADPQRLHPGRELRDQRLTSASTCWTISRQPASTARPSPERAGRSRPRWIRPSWPSAKAIRHRQRRPDRAGGRTAGERGRGGRQGRAAQGACPGGEPAVRAGRQPRVRPCSG